MDKEYDLLSAVAGMEIANPHRYAIIGLCEPVHLLRPRWTEIRRSDLIWRLKTKKALLNKIWVVLLMILSSAIIFSLLMLILIFIKNQFIAIELGILGGMMILLCYYFWTDRFETDPNFIRVTHGDKKYN